jgi:hypothetical protein
MHDRCARLKGASCENAKASVGARLDNIDFQRGRAGEVLSAMMGCEKDVAVVVLEYHMLLLKPN